MLNSASCPLVQCLSARGVQHVCAWLSECSAVESRLLLTLGARSTLSFKVVTYLLDVCHFPCYDAFHSGYGEMRKVLHDLSRLSTFFLISIRGRRHPPRGSSQLSNVIRLIGYRRKTLLKTKLTEGNNAWRTSINTCKEKKKYWKTKYVPFIWDCYWHIKGLYAWRFTF